MVDGGFTANGPTDTTFEPGKTCSLGQIVMFLYRAWAD